MTTDADRSSFFIALVVVDIFVGLADAISGPYIVLFLVDRAGFSPLSLSAVLTARALSGIAFSAAFGAWIDKRTSVAPLLLALAGSAIGYALLGFTTDFVALLLIAALPVAIGAAAFSQSIALAKRNFSHANPHTLNRAIGVLRASWSLAWAIGPAVGAILIGVAGFRGAFFASAASGAIALVTLALVRSRAALADAGHVRPPKPANGGPAIALAFAALALFYTAMFLGSISLPIVLTTSLGGRGKRRRNHDEPVRRFGDRRHGSADLEAAPARRARGDCRRLCRLHRLFRRLDARAFGRRRSSGRRSRGRSASLSSPISGSASSTRSCRTAPAPPRRYFRTPVNSVPSSPRSASAAWRRRSATSSIFVVCAVLSAAGLALVCFTPAAPD